MKRATVVLAVLAAIFPGNLAAKELSALRLCGAEGCTSAHVPAGLHEFPGGAGAPAAPPAPGPFLEVELTIDEQHVERLWYVPSAKAFASDAQIANSVQWSRAGEQEIDRLIVAAAADVVPHRPRAVAAFVGNRRVEGDVSGYLDLFGIESPGGARSGGGGFDPVSIKTDPPSPWALTALWFYPDEGVLQRGPELVRLPPAVAADLRAARSIDTSPAGIGFDWPLVTGSLLVAFGLALTAGLLARRSRQPRPA